jgi:hypothetical protein
VHEACVCGSSPRIGYTAADTAIIHRTEFHVFIALVLILYKVERASIFIRWVTVFKIIWQQEHLLLPHQNCKKIDNAGSLNMIEFGTDSSSNIATTIFTYRYDVLPVLLLRDTPLDRSITVPVLLVRILSVE